MFKQLGSSALIAFLAFLAVSVTLESAQAQVPGDEDWQTIWTKAGPNDEVYATLEFGGGVVAGGSFTHIGSVAADRVAFWDGTDWSALGDGFDDVVRALVVYGGELYAGGDFNNSGGVTTTGLARWDGSSWQSVGGGLDYACVEDLAVYNGDLYLCGCFYEVGGGSLEVNGIAGWDGSSWFDLNGGTYDSIYSLAEFNGYLYATGYFMDIGFTSANHVARWDGSSWAGLGSGLTGEFGDPNEAEGNDLAVVDGTLVVAGSFLNAGGAAADGIVGWTGSQWTSYDNGSNFNNYVYRIGEWAGSIITQEEYGSIVRWNGSSWQYFGYSPGGIQSITDTSFGLIFGGGFYRIDSVAADNLALRDPSTGWESMAEGAGVNGDVTCLLDWNGMIVAGGVFSQAGAVTDQNLAAWDGSSWTSLGGGPDYLWGGHVSALADYDGDLVIGGLFTTIGGVPAERIARWDGSAWHALGAGSPTSSVSALTVIAGELYATGYWGGVQTAGHWDGVNWNPVGGAISGGTQSLIALGSHGGDLIMAGAFTSAGGNAAANIARWDGSAWQPLGAGLSGSVYSLMERDGLLYVGGSFADAGGAPASRIAVWDGATWSPLGDGLSWTVYDMASLDGELFATGKFTTAGGEPAEHVAHWDGVDWQAMGSGLDDDGRSLGVFNGELIVGGEFRLAGGKASEHIASWSSGSSGIPWGPSASTASALPGVPNPSRGATTFYHSLSRDGNVEMRVFDLRGRRVAHEHFADLGVGTQPLVWDGLDRNGKALAAGTYFVQIRSSESVSRHKVTLLR